VGHLRFGLDAPIGGGRAVLIAPSNGKQIPGQVARVIDPDMAPRYTS